MDDLTKHQPDPALTRALRDVPDTGFRYGEGTINGRQAYQKPRCTIAYAAPGSIHHCAYEDGHDRVGPGGQNKTLFDHGNPKTQAWWNNDSTHLIIDHPLDESTPADAGREQHTPVAGRAVHPPECTSC